MSSKRQIATARLHGNALLAAQLPEVEAAAARLWVGAEPDLLSETAGIIAGSWFASPGTQIGFELIAAGMLLTGPIDRDTLTDWIKEGFERAQGGWLTFHPRDRP